MNTEKNTEYTLMFYCADSCLAIRIHLCCFSFKGVESCLCYNPYILPSSVDKSN